MRMLFMMLVGAALLETACVNQQRQNAFGFNDENWNKPKLWQTPPGPPLVGQLPDPPTRPNEPVSVR